MKTKLISILLIMAIFLSLSAAAWAIGQQDDTLMSNGGGNYNFNLTLGNTMTLEASSFYSSMFQT